MLLASIVVVVLVLAFIALFFRLEIRNQNWMQMVEVDEDGNTISRGQPFPVPNPDRIAANGVSRVDEYVARLVDSKANHSYLLIFTPDGQRGMSVNRRDGKMSLGVMVDWRKEPKRETAVRTFFANRRIEPLEDYLASNGNAPDATRILEYPVSEDAISAAEICRTALIELCAVRETEALNFTFRER